MRVVTGGARILRTEVSPAEREQSVDHETREGQHGQQPHPLGDRPRERMELKRRGRGRL